MSLGGTGSGFQVFIRSPIIFVKCLNMTWKIKKKKEADWGRVRETERELCRNENHALIHFTQVVNSMQFTTLTHLSEVL